MPPRAGVGLKNRHFREIEESAPDVGFFEIHAENYMGAGGAPHARLTRIRRDFPLSVHGVGLSIGGARPLDREHLDRVKALIDRYEPAVFSEHLAWSTHSAAFLNDLLPMPYDDVFEIQETLGRRILLENPATYLRFEWSDYSEIEFLREVTHRTGCGLLLDAANVHVCAVNHAFSAEDYIDAFPMDCVEEIHLSGHAEDTGEVGELLLIDVHCTRVSAPAWTLYTRILAYRGPIATLIEWDNDIPTWSVFLEEAARAESLLEERRSASGETMQREVRLDVEIRF